MEFGTVTFFDGRDEKRFGFILADKDKAKVFFHLNNEFMVLTASQGGADPAWQEYDFKHDESAARGRFPRKGERIIFERADTLRGLKATKWSKDYGVEKMVEPDRSTPAYLHASLLQMTVEWDIVEMTFTDQEFADDSLFGNTASRIRALAQLSGFGFHSFADDPTGDERRNYLSGTLGERRTFQFKVYRGLDHERLIDLSVGRSIIENVQYDDLTRVRHARHWSLPDSASLEEIVRARDEYIDDHI